MLSAQEDFFFFLPQVKNGHSHTVRSLGDLTQSSLQLCWVHSSALQKASSKGIAVGSDGKGL